MKVITFVQGEISDSIKKEFELTYLSLKEQNLPAGLSNSFLINNSKNKNLYRIATIWDTFESLEKMRKTEIVPAAVAMFNKFDVIPEIEVWEVSNEIHRT